MTLQGNKTAATLVVLSAFVPNLLLTDDAIAQATAGDTMHLSAKVVNPLEVTPSVNFQLNFKSFAIKGTGSYLLMPGGTQSISNGVTGPTKRSRRRIFLLTGYRKHSKVRKSPDE